MKSWELFAAAIALVAGLWAQVKTIFHWLRGFVVATRWVDQTAASSVISYLASLGPRTSREPAYSMAKHHVRPLGRSHWIVYEAMLASGGLIWRKWKPLWIEKQKDGKDDDDTIKYTFSFLRGTIDWEDLLLESAAWRSRMGDENQYKEKRYRVNYHHGKTLGGEIARDRNEKSIENKSYTFYWAEGTGQRLLKWKPEDIGGGGVGASFEALALTPELLKLVEEIKFWQQSEKWYKSRGIAWKRGFLFFGSPGTGKTSLTRAAAEELDLPVHIFDLATMSNEDLRDAWMKMSKDTPCIALIEDVDGVFHGRTNIAPQGGMMSSGGLTFNELLNTVDGIERTDGILLVVTTNHKEHVDPALNRPGRIDREVEFGPLNYVSRLKVARAILADGLEAEKMATDSPDVAAAVFVEACCRKALSELYEGGSPYR